MWVQRINRKRRVVIDRRRTSVLLDAGHDVSDLLAGLLRGVDLQLGNSEDAVGADVLEVGALGILLAGVDGLGAGQGETAAVAGQRVLSHDQVSGGAVGLGGAATLELQALVLGEGVGLAALGAAGVGAGLLSEGGTGRGARGAWGPGGLGGLGGWGAWGARGAGGNK